MGHSEKSFLTKFTDKPAGKRLEETILVSSFLATKKIDYVRVHNVFANKKSLEITQKLNFDCNEVWLSPKYGNCPSRSRESL